MMTALIATVLTCLALELMGAFLKRRGHKPTSLFGWAFPLEAPRTIYLFIRELCK